MVIGDREEVDETREGHGSDNNYKNYNFYKIYKFYRKKSDECVYRQHIPEDEVKVEEFVVRCHFHGKLEEIRDEEQKEEGNRDFFDSCRRNEPPQRDEEKMESEVLEPIVKKRGKLGNGNWKLAEVARVPLDCFWAVQERENLRDNNKS